MSVIRARLVLDPKSGAEIGASIREALILALTEKRDATLIHNEREYVIAPFDVVDSILAQHRESE